MIYGVITIGVFLWNQKEEWQEIIPSTLLFNFHNIFRITIYFTITIRSLLSLSFLIIFQKPSASSTSTLTVTVHKSFRNHTPGHTVLLLYKFSQPPQTLPLIHLLSPWMISPFEVYGKSK